MVQTCGAFERRMVRLAPLLSGAAAIATPARTESVLTTDAGREVPDVAVGEELRGDD